MRRVVLKPLRLIHGDGHGVQRPREALRAPQLLRVLLPHQVPGLEAASCQAPGRSHRGALSPNGQKLLGHKLEESDSEKCLCGDILLELTLPPRFLMVNPLFHVKIRRF